MAACGGGAFSAGAGGLAGNVCAGGSDGATVGGTRPCPKCGLLALQSATHLGLTCGKGLRARGGWSFPCMIGMTQSPCRPRPSLAAPGTKPAPRHAAVICAQAPRVRTGCATEGAASATTSIATKMPLNFCTCRIAIAPVWITSSLIVGLIGNGAAPNLTRRPPGSRTSRKSA
jgi:hypothetical protein